MKDDLVKRIALKIRVLPTNTMEGCEATARAVLAIARPAILEEAAKVADGWVGSNFDGCAEVIAITIRTLITNPKES